MNKVKLTGHFCTVTAYTDTTTKIEDSFEWKISNGFHSATFLTSEGAWIEVRVKTSYFEFWLTHYTEGKVILIEGRLCTEVSRGSGVVTNYILLTSVKSS